MDNHLILAAAGGVGIGWWLNRDSGVKEATPCQCHCGCNLPEIRTDNSLPWASIGIVVCVLIVLNLILLVRLGQRGGAVSSFELQSTGKGRSGKGWYGAAQGLQILDKDQ